MAAHCKGDLTEKLRCCRPNALLRLVQWLVNDINGTKVIIVLQFDYVLQSVEDPSKFVAVPPPERTVQPEDEVKARVEANRAAALAIRDAKRRRQEAPPPSPEEAPLGIFRSSEEAKVVDAVRRRARRRVPLAPTARGFGKSGLRDARGARLAPTKARGRGLPVCDAGGRPHAADHVRNIAVTGVDKDDALKELWSHLLKFGADGPGIGQRRPVARAEAGRFMVIVDSAAPCARTRRARPQRCVKTHPGGGEGARARPERGRGPGERNFPRL